MATICLCLILGNEEDKIERLLKSFKPAMDKLSVVMAQGNGDQDGTLSLVDLWCDANGIELEWSRHENSNDWPHLDHFGRARQTSWKQGEKLGADYLMWADADDVLSEGGAAKIRAAIEEHPDVDGFVCAYDTGREITLRERIIKAGMSDWRYPIHEQLKFKEGAKTILLPDVKWIHKPTVESRPKSLDRNERILLAATADIGRNCYYLHQQYFQVNRLEEAKQYGHLALASPDLGMIEAYETRLNLAQMEKDGAVAKSLALEAFGIMPDRREALCLLCEFYLLDGNKDAAYGTARAFMNLPKPRIQYWSLNHAWYDWKGLDLYCRAARFFGVEEDEISKIWIPTKDFHPSFIAPCPTISVIHATLGRPQQAANIRNLWLSLADNPREIEYIFGLHSFDSDSVKALRGYRHSLTDKKGAGPNLEAAAAISKGEILVQAQDDIIPPKGWDTLLLEKFKGTEGAAFVAVGDGHRKDRVHVTSAMNRAYMEQKAAGDCEGCGFGHPGYFSMYWDTENSYRAYRDARDGKVALIDATDLIFYHDHPAFVKGKPWDATYKLENAPEHYEAGARLFNERNPQAATDGIMEGK